MKTLGQQTFNIKTDSKVIQEHIDKESEARNPVLMKYLEKVREMERQTKRRQQRGRQVGQSSSQKSSNVS
jgi:hypothetical protein